MSGLKKLVLQELSELERQFLSSETLIETSIREPQSGLDAIVLLSRNSDYDTDHHSTTVGFILADPTLHAEAIRIAVQERKLQLAAVRLPSNIAMWGIRSDSSAEVLGRRLHRLRELGKHHDLPHIFPTTSISSNENCLLAQNSSNQSKQVDSNPSIITELEIYGRVAATIQLIEDYDQLPERQSFSIYGRGGGCLQLLKSVCSYGCRPTAIANGETGSIYLLSGLPNDILALIPTLTGEDELLRYLETYAEIINEDLSYFVSIPTDILFLNDPSCMFELSCMTKLSSRFLVESFTSFCTAEAASYGFRKGVRILPRLLSSAGEAIARYYTASQLVTTSAPRFQRLDQLAHEIRNLVQEGVVAMQNLVNAYDLDPHTASRYLALTNRSRKKVVPSKLLLYQAYSPKRYRLRQVA